jgi:hypothetical protein
MAGESHLAQDAATALTMASARSFGQLAAELAKSVVEAAGKKLKLSLASISASYNSHLEATFERCSKIKTLINPDEPEELLSLYVNTKFRCADRSIDDFDLIKETRAHGRTIISGTAGGGKTMFMKYLWISFFNSPHGRIPIFIELRRLNDIESDDILTFMFHEITATHAPISRELFDKGISEGLFIFVLDAFDELLVEKRSKVEQQILALSHNNPKSIIIVSSRPDDRFDSWQKFTNYHVRPLDQKSVVKLTKQLTYDKAIKRKFIERVEQDLYRRHESFLSTPLLATLMLITFNQFADIPEKIHIFYDQAFDTLFARHDATKEAFKRKMFSELSIDLFKKYLSYFCLVSYFDGKYQFTQEEILHVINRIKKIDNIQIDEHAFVRDLMESVCLLHRDGLKFTFTHRSFQEFFSAYCLARIDNKRYAPIVTRISRRESDDVITMLYDMNPEMFETLYMLPNLRRLVEEWTQNDGLDPLISERKIYDTDVELRLYSPDHMVIVRNPGNDNYYLRINVQKVYGGAGDLQYWRTLDGWKAISLKFDKERCGRFIEQLKRDRLERPVFISVHVGLKNITGRYNFTLGKIPDRRVALDLSWIRGSRFCDNITAEKRTLADLLRKIETRHARRDSTIDEIFADV